MTAALVEHVLDEVTTELSHWSNRQASRPTPAVEQAEGERLLALALERLRRQRLAAGLAPVSADEEVALVADVRARLHGFGLLDQLLADPAIENLHANGCDRVSSPAPADNASGGRSWRPPTATWSSSSGGSPLTAGGRSAGSTMPVRSSTSGCRTVPACPR